MRAKKPIRVNAPAEPDRPISVPSVSGVSWDGGHESPTDVAGINRVHQTGGRVISNVRGVIIYFHCDIAYTTNCSSSRSCIV